jgi:raffinose/stachyose/melibiose transport system permease protein
MQTKPNPAVALLKLLLNVSVLLFTLSALFPIVWMFYSSLKSNQEFSLSIFTLPNHPTFQNFINAFQIGKINYAIFSSVFNTVIAVPIIILFSFIIGYFFARYRFPGKKAIYLIFLLGMTIPLHSLLVPLFVQFKWMGMLDNRFTLILPYICFNLPLSIFLFDSFIQEITPEIDEAAYIDGSSFDTTLFKVIFPMCLPIMSTVTVLSVLSTWNEFAFALILNKTNIYFTLPIWLTYFNSQFTTDYTGKIAGLVMVSLPK